MPDTDEIYREALCAGCKEPGPGLRADVPIIEDPEKGWKHLDDPRGPKHTPEPLDGTVAPANVWDCDAAAMRRLGDAPRRRPGRRPRQRSR